MDTTQHCCPHPLSVLPPVVATRYCAPPPIPHGHCYLCWRQICTASLSFVGISGPGGHTGYCASMGSAAPWWTKPGTAAPPSMAVLCPGGHNRYCRHPFPQQCYPLVDTTGTATLHLSGPDAPWLIQPCTAAPPSLGSVSPWWTQLGPNPSTFLGSAGPAFSHLCPCVLQFALVFFSMAKCAFVRTRVPDCD